LSGFEWEGVARLMMLGGRYGRGGRGLYYNGPTFAKICGYRQA